MLNLDNNSKPQVAAQDDNEIGLIGNSPLFQQLLSTIDAVAGNDCIVLLEGESGTGKELIAKRIHDQSRRTTNPFIPVNCPAVSESLFESQFYGHVKGSFTGAQGDTLGMVRAAEKGTLFLDEIGELPLHLQPKLLRLLQEKEVTPVGATSPIICDVRFVAATNRSLAKAVADGKFRRDLYHRLNVVRIQVPSLRQRPEDIELLLDFYLGYYANEYGMDRRELTRPVRDALITYPWPGNVRELCCWTERLYAANLPAVPPTPEIWEDHYAAGQPVSPIENESPDMFAFANDASGSLANAELDAIRNALTQAGNNRSAAAKLLNIHRTTLLRKMKQYSFSLD
ncbi:MAG: sigma-54 dependent transcriptional regulator [Phycisphaerae bacterium]|nr:sigma-54 dependent transcriptional regulator [Phycisphaerae bacterium]